MAPALLRALRVRPAAASMIRVEGDSMAPTLEREPYLQRVTLSTATIGWVSGDVSDEQVAITAPDGVAVKDVAGVADDTGA